MRIKRVKLEEFIAEAYQRAYAALQELPDDLPDTEEKSPPTRRGVPQARQDVVELRVVGEDLGRRACLRRGIRGW